MLSNSAPKPSTLLSWTTNLNTQHSALIHIHNIHLPPSINIHMKQRLFSLVILTAFTFSSCDTLQQVAGSLNEPTNAEIASGLKQALEIGVSEGADFLSKRDGYFKSEYKILLPDNVQQVTDKLKVIPGFSDAENILLERINRAAEDAASSAKPIFVNAIKEMTFSDALNILMGPDNSATNYLHDKTSTPLYNEFLPIINNSLNKFNVLEYWRDAVTAYNKLPFVEKANPNLSGYVTAMALEGMYGMVEKKERQIRTDISSRTTDLLKKVFAKQDDKG